MQGRFCGMHNFSALKCAAESFKSSINNDEQDQIADEEIDVGEFAILGA